MKTIYSRNNTYSFFAGVLLVVPVIVLLISKVFIIGMIFSIICLILVGFQSGIKHNRKNGEFLIYKGYRFLFKTIKRIKIKDIEAFRKKSKLMHSKYSLPRGGYSTTSKVYTLEIKIQNITMILMEGSEKKVDIVISLIERKE